MTTAAIERDEHMKIHGNIPTGFIRRAYRDGGKKAALHAAYEMVEGLTDEQVMMIARYEAYIDGVTPDVKFRLVEDDG